MRRTATPTSLLWSTLVVLTVLVAALVTLATPGHAAIGNCPGSVTVTAGGESVQRTIQVDADVPSDLRKTETASNSTLSLSSAAFSQPGTYSVTLTFSAAQAAPEGVGSHELVQYDTQSNIPIGSCAISVTVVTSTTTTTTSTTTTAPPTTTTTRPPTTTTRPPTTTTTTAPPTTTTTTSTTSTTTTTLAPETSTTLPTTTTTATTTVPPATSAAPETTTTVAPPPVSSSPPTSLVAGPPLGESSGTSWWVVLLMVVVILAGLTTIVVMIVPGASAAVGARALRDPDQPRASFGHRLSTSWLGALLWNRKNRVKGPSLGIRFRESEMGRAWKTRQDVKRTRQRIEERRRR